MKKFVLTIILIFLVLFFALSLFGAGEPKYTNDSFARLSYISGNAYIQKGPELGYEEGVVNMPVEEGDRLGTTDGRAEIYLGKKNYVRLDNNTKLDFLSLPKKGSDLIRLRLWAGNIYLSVNRLMKEKTLEVHTSDASFYILDEGLYRIDVDENKKTALFVFNGLVEAAGEEGSQLLKSEQSLEAAGGKFSSRPKRFLAVAEDVFDRWSDFRESHLRTEISNRYLPEELEDFERELEEYGEWVYLSPYGWVWVPGGVDADWRPYYRGRWLWLSLGGWTWLPYEPWGWVTFHYGRWHWGPGLGWYWIPASVWGPAWVWWYWGYDYFGWAPLSWWGYPVVIVGGRFYGHYYGPHYPYDSRALTVIRKDQLRARDVSTVALKSDSLKSLRAMSLSADPPPVRPEQGKVTARELGSNRFLL
ncbi:MAG: FecR domain-containing protein, partial [Candidatus Aminicenantes bacterium]|nr:FecR domain-containing protein [Candidatus Aminicenantes bacterium]